MNNKLRFILCAVFALGCFAASAQTAYEQDADSLVNVAYRQVAAQDLLGGVSVINVEKLIDKNYITDVRWNMQGLIGGWNGNSMWGMDGDNQGYLVLIDGVPRYNDVIDPSEVAQISYLKGAQAVVLYGTQAAKGVMLITTKRGKSEGINVSVRANTGFHVAKAWPEYMGTAEYMTYYNEARLNDGLGILYSDAEIYNYSARVNPMRYPDINMYSSEYLKKAYNRSDVSTEIEGGGERAKLYANIGFTNTMDQFKFGEARRNSENRLRIRGNVDMKISDRISAYANASTVFQNRNASKGNYWSSAATFRPNRFVPLISRDAIDPNAKGVWDMLNAGNTFDGNYFLGGTQQELTNVFGDMYAAGKQQYINRWFQFDTGVNIDLGGLLEGLSFKSKFAVDYAVSYRLSFDHAYKTYTPTWSNYGGREMIVALADNNTLDTKGTSQNVNDSRDVQTTLLSAQFDYNRTFNDSHNVTGMLLVSGWQRNTSGEYHRRNSANMGLFVGYNYEHRYYVDAAASLVHSSKLAEGNREKLSPSLTLGWRLSEENFMKGSGVIDDMMLSVSGSILNEDIDITSYYLYSTTWDRAYGWDWTGSVNNQYTFTVRGANPGLTYIQRREISANLRTSLWDGLVKADVSFFTNSMNGGIVERLDYPNYLNIGYPNASYIPYENYEIKNRTGFDFSVNLNKRLGKVDFSLGVNGTWYNTKWIRRNEMYDFDYQNRKGKPLDGLWGLQSLGLFQTQQEIENAPIQMFGGTVRPGDIRYVDQNGDNVIDNFDEVYLGKDGWYGSPFVLGINLTAKWKNFTFFALATGGFGAYSLKNNDNYYWISGEDKYSAVVRDRWTEATAKTATYPRLTTTNGANNFRASDFWMYKDNRFDLAKVQITYDMPERLLRNAFVKELSVYVSGSDLLTISKERKHMEMNVGGAPYTRFYNLGVRVMF